MQIAFLCEQEYYIVGFRRKALGEKTELFDRKSMPTTSKKVDFHEKS